MLQKQLTMQLYADIVFDISHYSQDKKQRVSTGFQQAFNRKKKKHSQQRNERAHIDISSV